MVQKAPGAYQTISEVSVQLDVPAHVLRFWESKFSVLKPLKRSGGRRYYRAEDIQLLKCIKSLLYDEGYTIKGAQNSLKKRTSASGSVQTNETNSLHQQCDNLWQKPIFIRRNLCWKKLTS